MLFNSIAFAIFLPIVFLIYWFLCGRNVKLQNVFLLMASYFFYSWWDWRFLGLLFISTLIDYSFGFLVSKGSSNRRKLFLWLSIFNNLAILGFFKYYNFFIKETQFLLGQIGLHFSPYLLKVLLPVGISFYTFHGISYVLDIYYKKVKPERSFVNYGLFVSFFPLLVAGPIERAWHLLPQIKESRQFNYAQARTGMGLILYGLFKKIVISDSIASSVDMIFQQYAKQSSIGLITGAVLFSFQIYADFSGYSDIAIGTAKLFGLELFSNFRFPYFSRNIAEFWKRWHISLSSWFRDYVFIPLGGSKVNRIKFIRNILIVFLLSAFWHGANWTFIIWGLIHAVLYLVYSFNTKKNFLPTVTAGKSRLSLISNSAFLKTIITFLFVTLAWIFFRSPDIKTAINYTIGIFTQDPSFKGLSLLEIYSFVYIIELLFLDWLNRHNERELAIFNYKKKWVRFAMYIILAIQLFNHLNLTSTQRTFIYFKF